MNTSNLPLATRIATAGHTLVANSLRDSLSPHNEARVVATLTDARVYSKRFIQGYDLVAFTAKCILHRCEWIIDYDVVSDGLIVVVRPITPVEVTLGDLDAQKA